MEHLEYEFKAARGVPVPKGRSALAGVVASGNLEVMMESAELGGGCRFVVDTAAHGFGESWRAVFSDFVERRGPANLLVSVNDNAASPAVACLRLEQALEDMTEGRPDEA